MRISCTLFTSALSLSLLSSTSLFAQGPAGSPPASAAHDPGAAATAAAERATVHASPDWLLIAPHLPDPATASPDILETEGDVLRARRFPEDALDFYAAAIRRGGDKANLLNKIGVTQIEMGNPAIARAYFQQVVKLRAKDPQSWNNLGAVQFMEREYLGAIHDYKRAIKLNRKFAVSHSNLGMAYIEQKDYSSAKSELALALKLDPQIFQRTGTAGVSLHMLTSVDRANFCFQMAKVYARMGNEPEMIHSLEMAAQAGYDVHYEMARDTDLGRFVGDPRVVSLLQVAKSLREGRLTRGTAVASALPPAVPLPPGQSSPNLAPPTSPPQ